MISRFRHHIDHLLDDSGFRGPVLKLLSGTGYAFILAYIAKTVLLRIYDPGDFGIYAAVFAIVSILTPLVTLRYEDALMISDTPRRSAHAFILSMGVLLVMSALLLVLIPFRHDIEALFGEPAMADWIWTVPFVLLIQRGAKNMELWLTRSEQFGSVSMGQVVQSTTMTTVRIGLGFWRSSPGGLIYGFAAGHFLQAVLFARRLRSSLASALASEGPGKTGVDRSLIAWLMRRYRKFPMFTTPAAMISAGVSQMPALLLLYYFDKEVLGIYSQSFAVLFIPMSQLGMTIAQVFFVRAVEANRSGTLAALSANVHRRMVMMAWIPTGILMVAGGDIFGLLFGDTWRASGDFILYLGPWILLTTVASPLTRLFDVLERQRYELVIAAVMFMALTGALIVGGRTGSVQITMLLLGVGGAIVRASQLVLLLRLAGVSIMSALMPYLRYILVSAPLLTALYYVQHFYSGWQTLVAAVLVSGLFGLYVLFSEQLLHRR